MFNIITTLLDKGGPVMIPILAISLIAWTLIFYYSIDLYIKRRTLRTFITKADITNKDYQLFLPDKRDFPFIDTLRLITNSTYSGRKFHQILTTSIELEKKKLSGFSSILSSLAAVAPLLGLLGTVTGMIAVFNAVSLHGTGDPTLIGNGISQALITTETGLAVAIPILLMHSYLSSRVDAIVTEIRNKITQITTCTKPQKESQKEI
ncbi:MAG: MotA/TolQ/ExbB proton channel family protein [Planctomycetota bacterium]